jgi:hypothetical protein
MVIEADEGSWFKRLIHRFRWSLGIADKQAPPDESLGPARPGEIRPPWIEYPGFPSYDFFWRQTGEAWKYYVWEPYYESLTPEQQAEYLAYWRVPQDWLNTEFNPEWWAIDDGPDEPAKG